MGMGTIWVYGEVAEDGALSSMTTEILAKARELADDVHVVVGAEGTDAIAASAGANGASTVHATGDLAGGLQGVHVAAAIAAAIEAGSGPAAVLAGTTYDGRDVAARLSVAVDAPVITPSLHSPSLYWLIMLRMLRNIYELVMEKLVILS